MEGLPGTKKEIIGVRHLEDEDALMTYGFDTPLKEGQEVTVNKIADQIIEDCKRLAKDRVDFIFSTQKRTADTASFVKDAVLSKNEDINISLQPDRRLADLNQGKLIFPEGYKDGDFVPGLSVAWKAFWEQSFDKKNLLYRFGDPIVQSDGTYMYPELEPIFSELGESCAEFTYRLYDFLGSLEHRDYDNTLNVIIGHTATVFIMHEFIEISKDLSKQFVPHVPVGELPGLSWTYLDKVKKYLPEKLSHGNITTYEISDLIRPEIQEIIRIERDILKGIMVQSRHEK